MTAVELVVYALLLAVAAAAVWRRPVVALYLFVVGLALHNAVMAALSLGISNFRMVPGLNDSPAFVDALAGLVRARIASG